jgi:amphi-Trp domain-containing protein
MDIAELEQKERMSREAAAERLRQIADELASGNSIRIEQGGLRFSARVPDEVDLKIEFELEDDGAEFEIELSW